MNREADTEAVAQAPFEAVVSVATADSGDVVEQDGWELVANPDRPLSGLPVSTHAAVDPMSRASSPGSTASESEKFADSVLSQAFSLREEHQGNAELIQEAISAELPNTEAAAEAAAAPVSPRALTCPLEDEVRSIISATGISSEGSLEGFSEGGTARSATAASPLASRPASPASLPLPLDAMPMPSSDPCTVMFVTNVSTAAAATAAVATAATAAADRALLEELMIPEGMFYAAPPPATATTASYSQLQPTTPTAASCTSFLAATATTADQLQAQLQLDLCPASPEQDALLAAVGVAGLQGMPIPQSGDELRAPLLALLGAMEGAEDAAAAAAAWVVQGSQHHQQQQELVGGLGVEEEMLDAQDAMVEDTEEEVAVAPAEPESEVEEEEAAADEEPMGVLGLLASWLKGGLQQLADLGSLATGAAAGVLELVRAALMQQVALLAQVTRALRAKSGTAALALTSRLAATKASAARALAALSSPPHFLLHSAADGKPSSRFRPSRGMLALGAVAALSSAALVAQLMANRHLASQLKMRDRELAQLVVKILNLQEALGRGPSAGAMGPLLRHTSVGFGGGRPLGDTCLLPATYML